MSPGLYEFYPIDKSDHTRKKKNNKALMKVWNYHYRYLFYFLLSSFVTNLTGYPVLYIHTQ